MDTGQIQKISQSENNIKNIVQETMRECTNRNIVIDEDFVQYYVRLLTLDPAWNVHKDKFLDRNDVIKFVQHCLCTFQNQVEPTIVILKMQLYFKQRMEHKDDMIQKTRQEMANILSPLEKDIFDFKIVAEDETQQEILVKKLYKKVIFYVTLRSGLGDPTVDAVYKEVSAALSSIFTDEQLIAFSLDENENKANHLTQLTELIVGIRLFNRDCGKGGQGIEDLPKILLQAVETSREDIERRLVLVMERVNTMTTALLLCFQLQEDDEKETFFLRYNVPSPLELDDVYRIRDLLILYRQYELFVRKIFVEVNNTEAKSIQITENLKEILKELHQVADDKIAIPTVQIFPIFHELTATWYELQNAAILLVNINRVLDYLHSYTKLININNKHLKKILDSKRVSTEEGRTEETIDARTLFALNNSEMSIIDPEKFQEFYDVPFQYLGFCPWKLVETGGGLQQGDPKIGIIRVRDMFFVFSSMEAALAFARNPKRFILRGLDLARKHPELINFLNLEEQLMAVRQVDVLVPPIPVVKVVYNQEIQTEDHIVLTKIDRDYMWNIWDWKRQAIMLADISQRRTKAPQTNTSRARQPIRVQTHGTKEVMCQTKKDNYTNVPTLSNFIFGLRGRHDDNQHIVELTRPVDE